MHFTKDKVFKYFVYLTWAFFLFSGIWDLFHLPGRAMFWFGELAFAVIIYYKVKVPKTVYLGLVLVLLANLFGELYLGLFYVIPSFDKILHLFSPLIACTVFYFLLSKKIQNKKILILLSVCILLSFELTWEIIEYFSDRFFHTLLAGVHSLGVQNYRTPSQLMPPYEDTIYDMFYNLIGSIIFAVGALFFTRNKKKTKKK